MTGIGNNTLRFYTREKYRRRGVAQKAVARNTQVTAFQSQSFIRLLIEKVRRPFGVIGLACELIDLRRCS
jgi:hypothetical protein